MLRRTLIRPIPRIGGPLRCEALPPRQWQPRSPQRAQRYASSLREGFTEQFRKSPFMFPFALGAIAVVSGILVFYVPWYYRNIIVKPYHNFPEPVAKKLRRAIFYSRGNFLDIREANKYFRQALALADELGMDPFSDEIMGVKYSIAALFEENGYYSLATDVLEIMRADCQRWVDDFSDSHWTNGNRSRVMKNMLQVNLKLGQLYDIKYVNEPETAEKRLIEAVESALSEKQRRERDGIKPGEGPWLTDEEMGGTLEALATHYEQFDSHYLATPLFVKALEFVPKNSCHSIVIMNNISSCLAQQSPTSPTNAVAIAPSSSNFPVTAPPPRSQLIDQARQWAQKAIAHAETIQAPDRDQECDVGCAVATHNLGEFLEMEGKIAEAKILYEEAGRLSKKMGFKEGQGNAKSGLKRCLEAEKRK